MSRGRFGLVALYAVVVGVLAPVASASVPEASPPVASPSQGSVAAAPGAGPVLAQGGGAEPNFVVVVTDDQRWDTIGRCLPTFDGSDYTSGASSCMPQVAQKLVANGVTFLKGEVTQSLCCPSRASILTGQTSSHTGVVNLEGSSFDDSSSLATWLDAAGYRTGLIGKYLNGYGSGTLANYIPPGWDAFHSFHGYSNQDNPYTNYPWIDWDEGDIAPVVTRHNTIDSTSEAACATGNLYSTDLICDQSKEFLTADQTLPFLLYVAPISPHSPNTPPSRYAGIYNGLAMPQYPSHNVIPSPNPPGYLPAAPIPANTMSRYASGMRAALVSNRAADDLVGVLYDQLSSDGRLGNTVWVFISDNGFATGEHRLTGKQCPYVECHRVPFVVVCPNAICPGAGVGVRDASNYALNIDIAPTIAELAGVTPTLRVDGRSLVPILSNPAAAWRDEWLLYDNQVPVDGVVAKAASGAWYKYLDLRDTGEIQLFNLTTDPWELTNLWNNTAYTTIQNDMAARLADSTSNPTLTITSSPPASGSGTTATIAYSSNESVTFECGLDGAVAVACGTGTTGSVTYTGLAPTSHTVKVQAVDGYNNVSSVVTVTFSLAGGGGGSFLLTVTKAGTGTGTVKSAPAGIKCGTDCSESYTSGTSVTLTAKPTGGSTFAGWSGACTGTGTCVVSVTAATTATATFTAGS